MSDSADGFGSVEPESTMLSWYADLLRSVSRHVSTGRRQAVAAVTQELTSTYLYIGQRFLVRQDSEGYGTKMIDRLSADLKRAFPGAKGFSPRNLTYTRTFAATWTDRDVVQAPLAQLPWCHQIALLGKLADPSVRLWYASQAVDQGWSRNILVHQIDTRLHTRAGRAVSNVAATLPPEQSDLAQQGHPHHRLPSQRARRLTPGIETLEADLFDSSVEDACCPRARSASEWADLAKEAPVGWAAQNGDAVVHGSLALSGTPPVRKVQARRRRHPAARLRPPRTSGGRRVPAGKAMTIVRYGARRHTLRPILNVVIKYGHAVSGPAVVLNGAG